MCLSLGYDWLLLPESLWLTIFSKCDSTDLLNIKDVCHQWKRIAKDISLTSHLDLTSKPISINLLLKMISFAENNIKSIRIRGHWNRNSLIDPNIGLNAKTINTKVMKKLMNKCKQLKSLYLIDINDMISCQHLPQNLIHLSVNYCEINSYHFFYPLDQKSDRFETIKCLDISYFELFDSLMCRLLNEFKSLKCLFMEGLMRVNDGGITHLTTCLVSQLVVIDLEGSDVKDESFQYIINNANKLQELYLGRTLTTAKIDFNKSVSKSLKFLCLLNTLIDCESVVNIMKTHSSLISLNCNQNIREIINSPILTTKVNNNNPNNNCLHYQKHRCDRY